MKLLLKANDKCWCGSGKKYKRCHKESASPVLPGTISPLRAIPEIIKKPSWAEGKGVERWDESDVKSAEILEKMRGVCREAADTLSDLGKLCQPGTTTDTIDAACHQDSIDKEAYPSPLLYPGGGTTPFPKSLCTSVNEVICHGIPDDRQLLDGDIVNLDVTLFKKGVHGDTNATFFVGEVDELSKKLVRVTRDCLKLGIEAAKPGNPINEIGRAIQNYAEEQGFGVVKDFVGHGIGEQFHTDLQICHYYHPRQTRELEVGMVFTIEPMITAGSWRARMWDDGWTAVTTDGGRTAQFEHTILITKDGAEILTTPADTSTHPYWTI
jgi:methionyl aminopeptidase